MFGICDCLQDAIPVSWRADFGNPALRPYSLGYFRGKTRVTVLMTMLSVARDNKLDKYEEV